MLCSPFAKEKLSGRGVLNDCTTDHLDFTVAKSGADPVEGWCDTQAVRSAHSLVEQRLSQAFAELDCQTGDVEVRQQLYATLVHKAISLARQRLPDNPFLEDLLRASRCEGEGQAVLPRPSVMI